jgi:hypothetical protein
MPSSFARLQHAAIFRRLEDVSLDFARAKPAAEAFERAR